MSTKRFTMLMGAMLVLIGGLVLAPFVASANLDILRLQNDDGQWVIQRKNYSAWGYSTLNQITKENVKNLKVAWSFSTGTQQGHEGVPLVVGTTMYVHSSYPNYVYALDLTKEGAPIKWMYVPKQDARAVPVACCDLVHRGLNYAEGKILMHTLDAQIIALDATTGKELWKVRNGDPTKGETMTGAGIVIGNKYIQGISGAEFGVRCWVTAFDINTGKQLWKAYSTGPDAEVMLADDFNSANPHFGKKGQELGVKTWPGDEWKRGGGSTWGYWSYDPDLHLFYYGTGNPGTWNPTPRKGDNKWSMTIFARNPDTGMAKWGYQMTPWDAWDYDGVNEGILTEQVIGGKKVKALTHFDRNGFAYTLDRTNGSLLVAEPFVFVNWATGIDMKTGRPIEVPEKRTKQGVDTKDICPCAMGGKDQQPAAYSPRTNLFYVPTNNMCMNYEGVLVQYTAGAPYVGANLLMFAGRGGHWGEFIAWDGANGKKVWGIREPQPAWAGALVTGTDLVFYGTMDGWLKAADATNGAVLWKHKVGSGIIAPPMTYIGPDGKQYVAVLSGVGGWFGAIVSLDLPPDDPFGALGEVGAAYASGLDKATRKGGTLYVFSL
jgi:PQQ-dependent dehydrogenase (methanol/ethanol family)